MPELRVVVSLSLVLAGFAACQKSSLQSGGPSGGINPLPDGGPGSSGAAGTSGALDGGFGGVAGPVGAAGSGGPPTSYPASQCVTTSSCSIRNRSSSG